jgi:hypothetical protein
MVFCVPPSMTRLMKCFNDFIKCVHIVIVETKLQSKGLRKRCHRDRGGTYVPLLLEAILLVCSGAI